MTSTSQLTTRVGKRLQSNALACELLNGFLNAQDHSPAVGIVTAVHQALAGVRSQTSKELSKYIDVAIRLRDRIEAHLLEYHAEMIRLGGDEAVCERELCVALWNLRCLSEAGIEAIFATSH